VREWSSIVASWLVLDLHIRWHTRGITEVYRMAAILCCMAQIQLD
jgi:hypothetical protein